MKKSLFTVSCAAICVSVTAAIPVTVTELKMLKPVDTYYVGKTVAIGTDAVGDTDAKPGILAFDNSCRIKSVKPVGSVVFSTIRDTDGNIVRKGTVVASAYRERQENALQAAILDKKITEEEYAKAKKDFLRIENLFNKKVGSKKEYFDQKTAYLEAKLSLDEKNNELALAEWDLKACDLVAPFSGIVTQIWRGANRWAGDGDEVVTVQRMDPMMVKIPFPREIVEMLSEVTKIKVYPQNAPHGPVDSWVHIRTTDFNNIYAYVSNKIVPERHLGAEEKKLPKVHKLAPVMKMYHNNPLESHSSNKNSSEDNIPLAIPQNAIRKDVNGNAFVFAAKVIKVINGTELLEIKKVRVVLGNIVRDHNLGTQYVVRLRSLKDTGGLKEKDIVVVNGTDDLKTGKAAYVESEWLFLPGQLLKLEIPSLSKPGLYVSRKAIIHQSAEENYVYVVDNGVAKLVRIKIVGNSLENYAIRGEGIKPGTKVIVLDDKSQIKKLYDGVRINVKGALPAPERITRKRVDEVIVPIEDVPKKYYF